MGKKNTSGSNDPKAYTDKDQWEDDLDLPPIGHEKERFKTPILEKAEFDKKRKQNKFTPLLLTAALIMGLGSFFIFRKSDDQNIQQANTEKNIQIIDTENESNNQTEESEVEQEYAVEDDSLTKIEYENDIQEDAVIVEEINEEINIQNEEWEYKETKNYHIIVGSFENRSYAQSWLDKTAYGEVDIQYIQEYNGWYRVILFSFASNEEAEIAIDSVRNDLKLKAWIAYMN